MKIDYTYTLFIYGSIMAFSFKYPIFQGSISIK